MSESYVELIVARKKRTIDAVIKGVVIGLTVVFLLCFLLSGSIIFIILAAAAGAACYFFLPSLDLEYEYLYLDREISIDKIMSRQKRKHVANFDLNKMELLAPEKSHRLDSYRNNNQKKIKDYSSGEENGKRYAMIYQDEGMQYVLIEPNEEMLRCIRNVYPRKVFVD